MARWDYGSQEKMDVSISDSPWGKQWVKVHLKKSNTFWPSFEDLFRIIQGIATCEDLKYPGGRGRDMVADFLADACYCDDFEELREKYQIPLRPVQVF